MQTSKCDNTTKLRPIIRNFKQNVMCVGKTVLVVDDCEDNLLLMRLMLEMFGFQVISACNGEDGIAKVSQTLPDLIILDLMMPDISGLEVIKRLRDNCKLPRIPTMLLTANVGIAREEAISADELFYKPFDMNSLISKVSCLLSCEALDPDTSLIAGK